MTLAARIPVLDDGVTVADDAQVTIYDSHGMFDLESGPVPDARLCGGDKHWHRIAGALRLFGYRPTRILNENEPAPAFMHYGVTRM